MADYAGTIQIGNPVDLIFDYLSDVENLPAYFARMTEAHPTGAQEVHTTATLPDGHQVQGDAWWRTDEVHRRVEWGAEDGSGYRGRISLHGHPDGTKVELHLHTPHDEDPDVQAAITDALHSIKSALETSPNGV
ncbi:hypothetical protein Q6348_10690 [Isoptericola sp. b441]|uniref:Cyclase n=1 Tax=Actinotalea lenta TaxID=3064654 RepID=A0ABT9D9T4_9CELL|nr:MULTISPECIES: hypothetical protein [unclassified Isoptericola]MDO8107662.1 hypothetical protein [Isoptericola sp. b441]MDO8120678.1 hypothetical protein [Isoptericola sp. b490]